MFPEVVGIGVRSARIVSQIVTALARKIGCDDAGLTEIGVVSAGRSDEQVGTPV